MATIDLATHLGAGIPQSVHSTRFPINYLEETVDLAAAATAKGSALAAADVIQAMDIPSNSVILAAGLEVINVSTGSTVLTVDVGTGADADVFVDGFDYFAAVAGDFAAQPAAYEPIVIGNTADTLDITIATLTTTNTGGKLRIWALVGDIKDVRNPGIAQRKS